MGKASKWIKSFIGGKKDKVDKEKENNTSSTTTTTTTTTTTNKVVIPPPQSTPKEKKRWSFRRSSATAPKDSSSNESTPTKPAPVATSPSPDLHDEPKKPDVTIPPPEHSADIAESEEAEKAIFAQEAAAATKIQSIFRSYLARKALRALRGLVKIQALVRGHLVRKQATVTLRCMQALVTAQARARAHRIKNQDSNSSYHDFESGMMEENVKIVEMDQGGESHTKNNNYSNYHYPPQFDYTKQDYHKFSPAPSAITAISPRTCSGHFEDYTYATAQSSPQCYYSAVSRPDPSKTPFAFPSQDYPESLSYDYPLYPNYMANTKSSRAKARSQSAPKQRPETFERQLSKRRPSVEGRNIPRAVRMQRSSSHVGATAQGYQYPCSVRLDKSTVSLIESECGSNCSAFTNANYCRTVISYDPQGNRY